MKPASLIVEPLHNGSPYVRDVNTGLIWHQTPYRVLYVETDRSGVVYHSNYLVYFERGRAGLMRDAGRPYSDVEKAGFIYPIIKTGLNYYHSVGYDQDIRILSRPSKLERVRVSFDYVILEGDCPSPAADGFTIHCALNQRRMPTAVDSMTKEVWGSLSPVKRHLNRGPSHPDRRDRLTGMDPRTNS